MGLGFGIRDLRVSHCKGSGSRDPGTVGGIICMDSGDPILWL